MPTSPIAIPFTHDLECFDPGIDVFNHNSLFRQLMIKRLLLLCQRMVFALLERNTTIFVQIQQALITAVRQQQYFQQNRENRQLEQLEVMYGTLCLVDT